MHLDVYGNLVLNGERIFDIKNELSRIQMEWLKWQWIRDNWNFDVKKTENFNNLQDYMPALRLYRGSSVGYYAER